MFQDYSFLSDNKVSRVFLCEKFRATLASFYSCCNLTRLSEFFLDRTAWFFEFVAGLVVVMGLVFVVALLLWYKVLKLLVGFIFFFFVLWCFSFGYRMWGSYKDVLRWANYCTTFEELLLVRGVSVEEDYELSLPYVNYFSMGFRSSGGVVNCSYLSVVSFCGLLDEYNLLQELTFKVFNPLFKKTGFSWFVIWYSLLGERFFEGVGVWLPFVWSWYFDCVHIYLKYLLKINFTVERVVLSFVLSLGSVLCIFMFVPSLVDLGPYDAEFLFI